MTTDELEVIDTILGTWVVKNHAPADARILIQTAPTLDSKWTRTGEVLSDDGEFNHDDVEDRLLRAFDAARDADDSLRAVLAYRSATRGGAGRPTHIDTHIIRRSRRIELDESPDDPEVQDEVREAARSGARTVRQLRQMTEEITELVMSQRDGIQVLAQAQRAAVAEIFPWQTQVAQILAENAHNLAPLAAVFGREISRGFASGITPEAVQAALESEIAKELVGNPGQLSEVVQAIKGLWTSD